MLACVLPVFGARQEAPPARAAGSIVFVGSSIFHRWTNLATHMEGLPIVNRAVDGLRTSDMLRMMDADVLAARPRVVAYYCGSNDVSGGEPAEAIFDRIRQFADRLATTLPGTRMVFMSINRAPEKRARWDVVDAVNRRVEAYGAETKRLQYVEVNPVLFNRDGTPRLELSMPDQLHFRPPAYDEFAKILRPVLARAFEAP